MWKNQIVGFIFLASLLKIVAAINVLGIYKSVGW